MAQRVALTPVHVHDAVRNAGNVLTLAPDESLALFRGTVQRMHNMWRRTPHMRVLTDPQQLCAHAKTGLNGMIDQQATSSHTHAPVATHSGRQANAWQHCCTLLRALCPALFIRKCG